VKDNFNLKGVKTSVGNRAYWNLYPPCSQTASSLQVLERKGAQILGKTKLCSFAGREEPTEYVDFQAPFNPRADGYQSPAGSSSGSAAAVAAYDWIDVAVGTDSEWDISPVDLE
jgi:Asp-tRNA(Asn)/Glu-tRNA(Gln) amidotransferase A subunit family amidase